MPCVNYYKEQLFQELILPIVNYVVSQISSLSCVSFSYVKINYVLAIFSQFRIHLSSYVYFQFIVVHFVGLLEYPISSHTGFPHQRFSSVKK